jgi:hypothetical protein
VFALAIGVWRRRRIALSKGLTRQSRLAIHFDRTHKHKAPHTCHSSLAGQIQSAIHIHPPKLGQRIVRLIGHDMHASSAVDHLFYTFERCRPIGISQQITHK